MQPDLVGVQHYRDFVIEVHEHWKPDDTMPQQIAGFVSFGHSVRWRNVQSPYGYVERRFMFPEPESAFQFAKRTIDGF